ncbi:UDP-glycosyltransferase UGT4-like isoform X1 [Haematobia irritans]|uniref:UDP-glycosyltransferase UGT4-like isoform X1 n=1 Tax=Haematobia irritans TaxID=7368 RepID=UPI003F50B571
MASLYILWQFLLILFVNISSIEAARILAFYSPVSYSNMLTYCAVTESLADDGHHITIFSNYPNPNAKIEEKFPDHYKYTHLEGQDHYDGKRLVNNTKGPYTVWFKVIDERLECVHRTLNHPIMMDFLAQYQPGDFDVVLVGNTMMDFIFGLGAHFQCPIVVVTLVRSPFAIDRLLGNPDEVSYYPRLTRLSWKPPLSFKQKLMNFIDYTFERFVLQSYIDSANEEFYRYNFPPDRYPPLEEVYKNISLVFTNHHFSQGPIRPNVPALIEIGGIQIKENPDPLPKDLAEIMDSAQKGIIYFSLGTNVQGSNLSKEKAKMIFNVLSKLPYTVLMKWGDSDFPGESPNIIYKAWLPQDDILAHSNVKLFITHGGQGSVVESQYHGVPMVGIPFFGDQFSNMANVEKSGFGLSLNYATLNEMELEQALLEVLNNPKYRENVQKFSKLYRDRPMSPRQLVRYWVDYVIRHKGAKHMQSPALFMSWWELQSLDVIAFLLAVIVGVVALLMVFCKMICCRARRGSPNAVKNKKKKQ